INSGDYNLIGNTSGICNLPGSHNVTGVDPLLGPLQNNGGPTQTHALLTGSPAIDAGLNVAGSGADQRGDGFDRTVGSANVSGGDGTDIGAFEVQLSAGGNVLPAITTFAKTGPSTPGGPITFTCSTVAGLD